MMPGVNYVIYGCSSARLTPRVSLYQSLTLEENIAPVITQDSYFFSTLTNITCCQYKYIIYQYF